MAAIGMCRYGFVAVNEAVVISAVMHHVLHEADIIIFGYISVLQEIWATMLRHDLKQIVNEVFRNKRMPEVKFRDIWLRSC
jgi:hypothetical protein